MVSQVQSFHQGAGDNHSIDKQTAYTSSTRRSTTTGDRHLPTGQSDLTTSDSEDVLDLGLPSDVAERLVKRTELRVSQVLSQSSFVSRHCRLYDLPRFERDELDIGTMIAYGGFSNVHEVLGFNVDTPLVEFVTDKHNPDSCIPKKYIVKNLNPKLALNPKKLVVGAKDLVMEAHFLSSLSHPNIIQLRGWSAAGVAGFSETGRADGFFLVFDRLGETLSRRITSWRERARETKRSSTSSKIGGMMIGGKKNSSSSRSAQRMQLFAERVETALSVASAVEYLHSKNIIYRDLKPANIGFDALTDEVKIFDFGLAVELPQGTDPNSTFNLAGNTGTSRYMAVEVIRKQPYNTKADVFSYSILLWELMALCKPYDGLVGQQVKECVSVFGERPAIPRTWPTNLRRILRRGWTESLLDRPTISEVKQVLHKLHQASTNNKSSSSSSSKLFSK